MNEKGNMDMNKHSFKLIFLLIVLTSSTSIWGDELIDKKYNGMQLAWTKVPSSNAEETEVAPKSKPKARQQTVQPAAVTPTSPAVSVTAPKPEVKSVIVPVAKPVSQPVPKTAPIILDRPSQAAKSSPSHESQGSISIDWLVGVGLDMGGQELGTVTYSDGSTSPVNANSGLVFSVGGIISNGKNNPFSTQLTLGYKSGGPKIWNKDVTWSAIPLEVIEHYTMNNIRMGLGISYQLNPQLKVDLPSSSTISKYNNAIGIIAQIGWIPKREHYSIDFRYTSIKFQSSDVPDAPQVNGSVGGLYATYYY